MDLSVVFLGTGARAPTRDQGVAATLVARGAEHLLIDCGEGTQRQMLASTPRLRHLSTILITHCHGDHVLGLPGLLATFSESRSEPLTILGPAGTADLVDSFRPLFGELRFPVRLREMAPGEAEARAEYRLHAVAVAHGPPALAWALRESAPAEHLDRRRLSGLGVPPGPARMRLAAGDDVRLPDGRRISHADVAGPPRHGRLLVFSGDTAPCPGVLEAARGADLLVHEATFLERDRAVAAEAGHSTAAGAAGVARSADVRLLALTHRSARYRRDEVEAEARAVFARTVVPEDFDLIRVPLPERGPPRLEPGAGLAGEAGAA